MLFVTEMQMESSLFGGWHNTHINKRCEQRGSRSQRYSWGVWWSGGIAWSARNTVFEKEQLAVRMRLRSIIPEEGVTREGYYGVRDILKEESFC